MEPKDDLLLEDILDHMSDAFVSRATKPGFTP